MRRLGRVLGASWGVLGASWSVLGSSWSVLERLGGVLERLGRVLKRPERVMLAPEPGPQLCLAAGNSQRFTKTLERLPTESYLYRKTPEDRVNVKIKSECRE